VVIESQRAIVIKSIESDPIDFFLTHEIVNKQSDVRRSIYKLQFACLGLRIVLWWSIQWSSDI
jgi:hypothetical protein